VGYKYKRSARGKEELETMASQLETGHDTIGPSASNSGVNFQRSNILNI